MPGRCRSGSRSSSRSAHSARADGLAMVLAGAAADTAGTAGGQSQGPRCAAARGGGLNRLPRVSRSGSSDVTHRLARGNVLWLLSVGGRAYAGRNGEL